MHSLITIKRALCFSAKLNSRLIALWADSEVSSESAYSLSLLLVVNWVFWCNPHFMDGMRSAERVEV